MALVVEKTTGGREYKVKDLSQADLGRLQIGIAEVEEMPGLMASRDEFGPCQPFKGARIIGSLPMTIQTAVLIETLTALGAQVRWCPRDYSSTQDHAAAAIARDSASVFAWKGQTLEEHWWCTERALDWGPGGGPDLIVDDGGEIILWIHEGVKAEEIYTKTGQLPEPSSTDNAELQTVLNMIRNGLKIDPMKYHKMKERLVGVSEETTNGVNRPYQMQASGTLLFPAINVTDSVTTSKFINLYGCRNALLDVIMRTTNMMISGKRAVVCGYEDASEGCAIALKQAGANVVVFVVDFNLAVQARLRGFSVIETIDDVVSEADIFVITGIDKGNIVVFHHIKKMKNNAIIYNMDPILDLNSKIIHAGLDQQCFSGMKSFIVNSQTVKWVFPDSNSSIIVLNNTGYPNFKLSWSCTSHVVAMLELWSKRGSGKYEKKVYALAEHLEEKVSALHLPKLPAAASVTMTTKKETKGQADHVSVPIQEQESGYTTCTEPKKGNKKKILIMGVQACSLFGIVVLGLTQASKVKLELSFCAIWG